MNRNSDIEILRQFELRPIGIDYKVAQIERKTSGMFDVVKPEEEPISPCIHIDRRVGTVGN